LPENGPLADARRCRHFLHRRRGIACADQSINRIYNQPVIALTTQNPAVFFFYGQSAQKFLYHTRSITVASQLFRIRNRRYTFPPKGRSPYAGRSESGIEYVVKFAPIPVCKCANVPISRV